MTLDFTEDSFVAGFLCLDFINTVGGHRRGVQEEFLATFGDFIDWSRAARSISPKELARIRKAGLADPAGAADFMREALACRESLFRLFDHIARGKRADRQSLDDLNHLLSGFRSDEAIVQHDREFRLEASSKAASLAELLRPIIASAVELLLSRKRLLLRECASESCTWLFVDSSKNRLRRWCDMKVCGNRAKVQRHRAREAARAA